MTPREDRLWVADCIHQIRALKEIPQVLRPEWVPQAVAALEEALLVHCTRAVTPKGTRPRRVQGS